MAVPAAEVLGVVREAARCGRARRCSWSRRASRTATSPRAASARRLCSTPSAPTGCGWSGPTRWAWSTPSRASSLHALIGRVGVRPGRPGAVVAVGCARPGAARPRRRAAAWASRRSSRWATAPTCRPTTCSSTGPTTSARPSSPSTWSPSATRGASRRSPGGCRGASRSSRSRAARGRPLRRRGDAMRSSARPACCASRRTQTLFDAAELLERQPLPRGRGSAW